MALKPPQYEPHGPVRNAASNPKKVTHSAIAKNTATVPRGDNDPTVPYIENESDPAGGRKSKKKS
jgi:hypothetical protein